MWRRVEWYFEGGTPGNSSIDNPTISYNEAGEFDVQLIVSNSISTDTSKKYNLIEVIESPEMSFAPLPSFCHNDPSLLVD
jgi:PKD repeat protein